MPVGVAVGGRGCRPAWRCAKAASAPIFGVADFPYVLS